MGHQQFPEHQFQIQAPQQYFPQQISQQVSQQQSAPRQQFQQQYFPEQFSEASQISQSYQKQPNLSPKAQGSDRMQIPLQEQQNFDIPQLSPEQLYQFQRFLEQY